MIGSSSDVNKSADAEKQLKQSHDVELVGWLRCLASNIGLLSADGPKSPKSPESHLLP